MELVNNDICKAMVVVGSFVIFWIFSRNNRDRSPTNITLTESSPTPISSPRTGF